MHHTLITYFYTYFSRLHILLLHHTQYTRKFKIDRTINNLGIEYDWMKRDGVGQGNYELKYVQCHVAQLAEWQPSKP